jgi:hypothetical protein
MKKKTRDRGKKVTVHKIHSQVDEVLKFPSCTEVERKKMRRKKKNVSHFYLKKEEWGLGLGGGYTVKEKRMTRRVTRGNWKRHRKTKLVD